jgi:hypothetical protein
MTCTGPAYIEILLAGREAQTGNLVAGCYNPMYPQTGIPASRDVAQAVVEGMDLERIKAEFDVLGASLDGPKIWTPDWSEAMVGRERDFDGITAPTGSVYDMQSASLGVDPDNTVDELPTLGERLALPEGWSYRARTLDDELVMQVTFDDDPPNTIVLDEFENNYRHLRNPSAEAPPRCGRNETSDRKDRR